MNESQTKFGWVDVPNDRTSPPINENHQLLDLHQDPDIYHLI